MIDSSGALGNAPKTARELERLGIPYLLGGALACRIHGEPRTTLDVDFAVHMTPDQVARLGFALESDSHVVPEALVEATVLKRMAKVIHKHPFVKLDLHVRAATGHSREEMQRAVSVRVGNTAAEMLRVATAEDVVLLKLRWYRIGDEASDRQWPDVNGVFERGEGSLDQTCLERRAAELGVTVLLVRAHAEARTR